MTYRCQWLAVVLSTSNKHVIVVCARLGDPPVIAFPFDSNAETKNAKRNPSGSNRRTTYAHDNHTSRPRTKESLYKTKTFISRPPPPGARRRPKTSDGWRVREPSICSVHRTRVNDRCTQIKTRFLFSFFVSSFRSTRSTIRQNDSPNNNNTDR